MKQLQRLLPVLFLIATVNARSQVAIGTPTAAASAQLDVTSTSKGLLIPRMTTLNRTGIASPATGLMVYDTDLNQFYYYNGTAWTPITAGSSAGWSLTGNAGTVDGTNFIGTTDNIPFNIKVNNQKAGRIDHINWNSYFGYQSGNANTSGIHNTAIGYQANVADTQKAMRGRTSICNFLLQTYADLYE